MQLFGVDTDRSVTPKEALAALIVCYTDARCADAGLLTGESAKKYCTKLVRQAFTDTQGDFDNPTKQSIIKAIELLSQNATGLHNQEIVRKHKDMMMQIIASIPETP